MEPGELSEKSRAILEAIAEGHSYEQILSGRIAGTYNDIFRAAAEALEIAEHLGTAREMEHGGRCTANPIVPGRKHCPANRHNTAKATERNPKPAGKNEPC